MSTTKKVEETNHRFKPMIFRAFNMVMALLVAVVLLPQVPISGASSPWTETTTTHFNSYIELDDVTIDTYGGGALRLSYDSSDDNWPPSLEDFDDGNAPITNKKWISQTFTVVTSRTIDRVELYFSKTGSPDDFYVEIQETTGGEPNGTVLGTAHGTISGSGPQGKWFTFSGGVDVDAGTQYALVFREGSSTSPPDPSNKYDVYFWNGLPYTGGQGWKSEDSGVSWAGAAWNSKDFGFRFEGAPYATPGYYVSSSFDTGFSAVFNEISWVADLNTYGEVKFQIRTAATEAGLSSATWYGPTNSSDFYTSSSTSINDIHYGDRWIQYKAFLFTSDVSTTPYLNSISISFETSNPSFTIEKDADVDSVDGTGDVITYTVTVVNDGNVTLTGGNMTDTLVSTLGSPVVTPSELGSAGDLDVGETWTWTYTYTVTQGDIDGGSNISNTATFDTNETDPKSSDEVATTVTQDPSFTIEKDADVDSVDGTGDVITYTVTVVNDGNVTLTGGNMTDTLVSTLGSPVVTPSELGSAGDLDVGETWTWTYTYTVTQGDIDGGSNISNTATFDTNETDPKSSDEVATTVTQDPSFTIEKDADVDSVDGTGDVITYTVTVVNDGNVTLTGGNMTDTLVSTLGSPVVTPSELGSAGDLDVGETWTWTYTYTVTQGDIDGGSNISNTATFDTNETDPKSSDEVATTVTQDPSFTIEKDADVDSVDGTGDVITYTVTVVNDGNVTLTGGNMTDTLVSTLGSPVVTPSELGSAGDLDVGETWTWTYTYTVTQGDIDGGSNISNTATFDTNETDPKSSDEVATTVTQDPSFTIEKDADVDSVDGTGDVITYTVTVVNDGNVTLTGGNMTDTLVSTLGSPVVTPSELGSAGDLDVGETWTWTYTYTVTQGDIDGGSNISNTATFDTNETDPKSSDEVATTVTQDPSFTIEKDADVDSVDGTGDVITYTVTVVNDGNVTLTGVTFSDTLIGVSSVILPDLPPGIYILITYPYTVTQGDINDGSDIVNTVTVDTNETGSQSDREAVDVIPPPPPPEEVPETVTVDPNTAVNPIGTNHTFTATVIDNYTNPMVGVEVVWTIESGPGSFITSPETITDSQGQAQVTITSNEPGVTIVRATVMPWGVYGEAEKIWEQVEANISITPETATNPISDDHEFTALITDIFDNPVEGAVVLWSIESGPGSFVGNPEEITDDNGIARATISSDRAGITIVKASILSGAVFSIAEKIWIDPTLYFTVDFLNRVTRVPMDGNGRILEPMFAPDPDDIHFFEMELGTRVLDMYGDPIRLIEIYYPPELILEPGTTAIEAFLIDAPPFYGPLTFVGSITFTTGYEVGNLPDGLLSLNMSHLDTTDVIAGPVWTELDLESDVIAGIGEFSADIEEEGIYAVLAGVQPSLPQAEFSLGYLKITRVTEDTWPVFTFVKKVGEEATISATVTNTGGEDGVYEATLKLNGDTVQTLNVSLSGGESKEITFKVTGNEPGDYTVEIQGNNGAFTSVVWINWWLIVGLLLAVIFAIGLIWYYRLNRSR